MRLWPAGITNWSTDEVWNAKAWKHLRNHFVDHGSFFENEVRGRFDRYGMEWKQTAVAYLAADIRRFGP